MRRALVVTDSRVRTAETEYAAAVAGAEAATGATVSVPAPAVFVRGLEAVLDSVGVE